MTDRPDPETEAVFTSISAQARETNRIRVNALEDLTRTFDGQALTASDRRRAKDLAHQIAGSAGTFGYVRASELAREIEGLLADRLDADSVASLRKLIAELHTALAEP